MLVEQFLDMLVAERGAAAQTLAAYRRDLAAAAMYLKTDLARASADDLARYLAHLRTQKRAASTIARHLSALRQYFRFLLSEGARDSDPTLHLERPKQTHRLPKTLSAEAAARLFDIIAAQKQKTSYAAITIVMRIAVRRWAARERSRNFAGAGLPHRPARAVNPRQGRQGTHGAADAASNPCV